MLICIQSPHLLKSPDCPQLVPLNFPEQPPLCTIDDKFLKSSLIVSVPWTSTTTQHKIRSKYLHFCTLNVLFHNVTFTMDSRRFSLSRNWDYFASILPLQRILKFNKHLQQSLSLFFLRICSFECGILRYWARAEKLCMPVWKLRT